MFIIRGGNPLHGIIFQEFRRLFSDVPILPPKNYFPLHFKIRRKFGLLHTGISVSLGKNKNAIKKRHVALRNSLLQKTEDEKLVTLSR